MLKITTHEEEVLDAKTDRIIEAFKRVAVAVVSVVIAILALILVLELKRAYQIDVFQGVNFSIDDWYFDKVGSVR